MEHVILTGFMGCGKSSLGVKLSYKLRMALIDTDKEIEREQGTSISGIFADKGETYFRQLETEYIERLKERKSPYVVSVGGGTPLRQENRELLKELGMVVYLRVKPQTVYERLKDDTTRPLLQGHNPQEKIERLMKERAPFYEEGADMMIDSDELETEEVLRKIVHYYKKRQRQRRTALWEGAKSNEITCHKRTEY